MGCGSGGGGAFQASPQNKEKDATATQLQELAKSIALLAKRVPADKGGAAGKRSDKCLNCGKDSPSKCPGIRNCNGKDCPKCGTKYCGYLLGIPCRVAAKDEPPDDATDVYGQKLSQAYRTMLNKKRAKYQEKEKGATALLSSSKDGDGKDNATLSLPLQ